MYCDTGKELSHIVAEKQVFLLVKKYIQYLMKFGMCKSINTSIPLV
jgi:hypothetical protein